MNQVVCAACGDHFVELPQLICEYDRNDLRQSLRDLTEWYEEMLSPPVRGHSGLPSGKNHERREDIPERVIQVRAEILEILLGWASLYWEKNPSSETGSTRMPSLILGFIHGSRQMPTNIDRLVEYLSRAESWFIARESEVAAAYTTEVQRLALLAQRTAAPGRREGQIVGVHEIALEDDHDRIVQCGNVWAKSITQAEGRCAGCGEKVPLAEALKSNPSEPDRLYTDEESVSYFAVSYGQALARNTMRVLRYRDEKLKAAARKRGTTVVTPRYALDDLASAKGWSPLIV